MARQVALFSLLVITAAFLLISTPRVESAVTCGTVANAVSPCINYIRGAGPLTPACCGGVKGLNAAANTTPARQTACNCLKSLAGRISGLNAGLARGLPGRCGVNVPFVISTSTDCTKVR